MSLSESDLPARYGSRFFVEGAPDVRFPTQGMSADDAYELIADEMALDGDPARNLATFVTTWMEPEAQRIIAENSHRNFIDHAEYPRTAEIEQRCIRMLGDLFNAPGEVRGARCQGSSEAIMLGGLAAKWRWRKRREAEGKGHTKPNLVYGRDVHVVWDKLCRYFDIEPKTIPMSADKFTIGPEDVEPLIDEHTIGVVGVLGTTFTGEADDIAGIDALLCRVKEEHGYDIPLHVDAASGGFVWPFLHPERAWDFRLDSVRSINVSGHKFGMVYPGIGWLIFREPDDLPEDLVFYENYLGETDATFTLNFSTGSAMVLAQYYNLCRFGREGYTEIIRAMEQNAQFLGDGIAETGQFEAVGHGPRLPLVCFRLADRDAGFDEFDLASQLAAERGWMVPAYSLPPNAEEVVVMRALVKENVGHAAAGLLIDDLSTALETLKRKGGVHERERERGHRGPGY
ncbi:MAG: glutamate decarboxylase [Solirubrobacterales bacterium]